MWGALMAPMFALYTGESIARVFFITAAAFAGTSLYGYTTKRDLSTMGRFLAMSTIGILVAVLRSKEHTSELQSLMRISYAVFCLKKKNKQPLELILLKK